jgi:hypothetical protein
MERALRKYGLLLALAALVVVGALAGCGSSDSSTTTVSQTVTRKQVVRMAQKYCRRGYHAQARAVEAYSAKHGLHWREPTHAEREELDNEVVLPFVERKIEFWKSLPVPPGDEPEIKAIIASMERGLAEAKAHPKWLAAPTAAHPETFVETRELTSKYGAWICGQA